MLVFMIMKRLKVTRGGQVSVPAEIRHRWGTSTLALEDHGDRIVLFPAADDPIAAARGGLRDLAPTTSEELRRAARAAEVGAAERRHPRTK
jgi:bifunctional DNA-binding transcriptional regulator/antitoxin component of YhaV-PrlF toxin-antitoxin module